MNISRWHKNSAVWGHDLVRSTEIGCHDGKARMQRFNVDDPKWFRMNVRLAENVSCRKELMHVFTLSKETNALTNSPLIDQLLKPGEMLGLPFLLYSAYNPTLPSRNMLKLCQRFDME